MMRRKSNDLLSRSVAWPAGRSSLAARWLASGVLVAALLAPVDVRAADGSRPYKVAAGDRISILVMGQADLSGEMMIDSDDTVVVPLIGRIPVHGLSVDEIQQSIAGKLAGGYVKDPVVSVRLIEPRPIYIVGDVKTPGSYPYRNGVSVLAAVALAGGYLVTEEQAQAILRIDYIQADERVRTLEATRMAQRARIARLEAQRDGLETIDFGGVVAPGQTEQAASILQSETEMFAFQTKALREQIDLLRQQEPKFDEEITFIRQQSDSETKQLALIRDHLQSYTQLVEKGLAQRFNGIELKREEQRNQGAIAELARALTGVQLQIGEMRMRIRDAEDIYQRRVRTELQDALVALAATDAALPTARATRELRLRQVGFVADVTGPPRRSLLVTRVVDDRSETIPVTDTTLLEPGDILRIERQTDERAESQAISSAVADDAAGEPKVN